MNFKDLIKEELENRRVKNPRYSLRALARDLEISPASLSGILNGTKTPSTRVIKKCGSNLAWPKTTIEKFLHEAKQKREIDKLKQDQMRLVMDEDFPDSDKVTWMTFAVSRLSALDDNSASPNWIADRINITKAEAKKALNFLLKYNCIQIKNNKMIFIKRPTIATNYQTKTALDIQESMLDIAKNSLRQTPAEYRFGVVRFSSMDRNRVAKIGEIIRRFCFDIEKATQTESAQDLYSTVIQVFPLEKQKNRKS